MIRKHPGIPNAWGFHGPEWDDKRTDAIGPRTALDGQEPALVKVGFREATVDMHSLFDTPVYRWLPAKSKIGSRFLLFYAKTPDGFRKVDDVRLEGGKLIVEDREHHLQIAMEASQPL